MKKLILFAFILLCLGLNSYAQDITKNALGLRLGDNDGFGGEISYQRGLSKNNRLELDLGWRNSKHVDALKITGLYHWVWNIEGGFNWYAGVGGGIGSWNDDDFTINGVRFKGESETVLFVAGDIGIEYNFQEVPIQLSLDFRPEIYFNDNIENDFGPDIALGIRYRFD
jgi:hypothetical protein